MSQIITISVRAQVPHEDRYIERQTAFTVEQFRDGPVIASTEIYKMIARVNAEFAESSPTGKGVLCTDGMIRVRKR